MSLPLFKTLDDVVQLENPDYLRSQIITYIGNKRRLLRFLEGGLDFTRAALGKKKLSILDLFSGTGIVARMAKKHSDHLIVNDLEEYSRISNECFLSNFSEVPFAELEKIRKNLAESIEENLSPGFITRLYSPSDDIKVKKEDRVFYTRRNAMYLDTARQAINKIPSSYRNFFLAPLLSQASIYANTSGVFKGFYKNKEGIGQFGGTGRNALKRILNDINLELPVLSNFECTYEVHREDANSLVHNLDPVDIAYFDPPYNQHPYGSNYFMLNLLCNYEEPKEISSISGIPKEWNRSDYNKRQKAEKALFDVVENCRAKFVLISYNSEGFISHDIFLKELNKLGRVKVMDTKYNTFRGCRNLKDRDLHVTEFLYLVDKR